VKFPVKIVNTGQFKGIIAEKNRALMPKQLT
jgi:hypothetical protein